MKKIVLLLLLIGGCSLSRGIELNDLKGKNIKEVEKFYGKPVVIHHEGNKQMWAYKDGECNRLIFFDETKTVQFAESRGNCSLQK